MLQQRKMLLIPLWCQDQDAHEPSTWSNLFLELFDAWREQMVETIESTQLTPDSTRRTLAAGVGRNMNVTSSERHNQT
jgi:hypothetical protein